MILCIICTGGGTSLQAEIFVFSAEQLGDRNQAVMENDDETYRINVGECRNFRITQIEGKRKIKKKKKK